jgi:hypothetical protein
VCPSLSTTSLHQSLHCFHPTKLGEHLPEGICVESFAASDVFDHAAGQARLAMAQERLAPCSWGHMAQRQSPVAGLADSQWDDANFVFGEFEKGSGALVLLVVKRLVYSKACVWTPIVRSIRARWALVKTACLVVCICPH